MSVIARKTHLAGAISFREIIMFSAWGFALVLASFLFLWLGHLMDELLGTAPKFMLGLFSLAIIGSFIELYQAALKIIRPNKNE
jgi:F0F1-type ATP synthase assembly protein I